MTAGLRKAHRRVWLTLAVALPLLLFAALALREDSTPPNPGLRWERLP